MASHSVQLLPPPAAPSDAAEAAGCYLVAPLPANESRRLQALRDYDVLDTAAEQVFDDLVRLAALSCDMPVALISLVDDDRLWFKAHVGPQPARTHRNVSFCAHAILKPDQVLVVADARRDVRFARNPAVTATPGIVFYAGAPLVTPAGEAIGTLCVADYKPRTLSATQLQILRRLADQVVAQLEMRRNILLQEATLETQTRFLGQLERHQLELEAENATDPLTAVGNRRAFEERLDAEMARARRYGCGIALMILDVDFFKRYNDSFGHPAGDAVLRQLARVMKRTCRGHDFVARVGGEEFALVLPDTGREGACVIAERLRRNVQRESWPNRPVTVSIGVAAAEGDAETAAQLIERADIALYASKRDGRNRVTLSGADTAE